jgi:hypothetical protein
MHGLANYKFVISLSVEEKTILHVWISNNEIHFCTKKNEVCNLSYFMYKEQVRDAWAPQTGKEFGAPDRLINWRPFKQIFFNLFRPREVWRRFLRERLLIADNFLRNAFEPGNICLLALYFRLFYWNLSALFILTPWAVARLAHSLLRPCIHLVC